jgi:hypothetical protein
MDVLQSHARSVAQAGDAELLLALFSLNGEHRRLFFWEGLAARSSEAELARLASKQWAKPLHHHYSAGRFLAQRNYEQALVHQKSLLQAVTSLVVDSGEWFFPLLRKATHECRLLAMHVVGEQDEDAEKRFKALEDLCSDLRNMYVTVSRESDPMRAQCLFLANTMLRIGFHINNLTILRTTSRLEFSESAIRLNPRADSVSYNFLMGRFHLLTGDLNVANERLARAFRLCPASGARKSKRQILALYAAVNMVLGRMPRPNVLLENDLESFAELRHATITGNISLLNHVFEKHSSLFAHWGILTLLARVRQIALRNLFKKVYVGFAQTCTTHIHAYTLPPPLSVCVCVCVCVCGICTPSIVIPSTDRSYPLISDRHLIMHRPDRLPVEVLTAALLALGVSLVNGSCACVLA